MGTMNQTKRNKNGSGDNDGKNDVARPILQITCSRAHVAFLGVAIFVVAGILLESAVLNNSFPSRFAASSSKGASSPFSTLQVPAAGPAWASAAFRCANVSVDRPDQFKAMRGEDKKLLTYFGGLCGGTYVELGALDGVLISNTYFFNRVLGWKGVLIELGPNNYAKLVHNRQNELAVVHAGVCEKRRMVHYREDGPTGGIVEYAAEGFKNYWWNPKRPHGPLQAVQEIQCLPMNDILRERVGESFYFDFLSLDVEGAEFEVLQTFDFTRYGFGVILIEADTHDERKNMAVRTLLVRNGYSQFEPRFDDTDWFVNNQFDLIYGHLMH